MKLTGNLYRTSLIALLAAIFLVACFPMLSYAKNEAKADPTRWQLKPFAAITQAYDDNIFLAPHGAHNNDGITTTTLGTDVRVPMSSGKTRTSQFRGIYYADIIEFWQHNNQRRVDHTVKSSATFALNNNLSVKYSERFIKTATPLTSELVGFNKRLGNDVRGVVAYRAKNVGLDCGYENILTQFIDRAQPNSIENILIVKGYYDLSPTARLLAEYLHGTLFFGKVPFRDDIYNEWTVGIMGKLNDRLRGTINAGVRYADYMKSMRFLSPFVYSGNVSYKLRKDTMLDIYSERTLVESYYQTNNYFIYDAVGGKLTHQLSRNVSITADGKYIHDGYKEETTEDDGIGTRADSIWIGEVGLTYTPNSHWTLLLDYKYRKRNSTFVRFDYTDNVIMGKATLSL